MTSLGRISGLIGLIAFLAATCSDSADPGSADPAFAAPPAFSLAQPPVQFDIPSMPLLLAIDRFMSAANVAVKVHPKLLDGQTSTPVKGLLSPEDALRRMLSGTVFQIHPARFAGAPAFKLTLRGEEGSATRQALEQYDEWVQDALHANFCQARLNHPPKFESAQFRLWLTDRGTAKKVELITSTGDAGFDADLVATVERLDVGKPVPEGFLQPVHLNIPPSEVRLPSRCKREPVSQKLRITRGH